MKWILILVAVVSTSILTGCSSQTGNSSQASLHSNTTGTQPTWGWLATINWNKKTWDAEASKNFISKVGSKIGEAKVNDYSFPVYSVPGVSPSIEIAVPSGKANWYITYKATK
ncbi:hypothetical protein [Alicyclobacillus sp. SP_1]|uniref:hypothetical protein n=1 Tax=Alicyclobacillus sp. SP_1 TaxID=2942475 RepID=UPI0021585C7A|nr:hypothetical protein [Alicyclobacillus sp. SP_1]